MKATLILIGLAIVFMGYCTWRLDRLVKETLTWREILQEQGIEEVHESVGKHCELK